ncbi:MAG TPA: dipeptide epimerase [Phycisphaerae bacterium]|nr:dipeptide epimerase [Phycisphaerae bacterium]HRY67795.1 dipeptide epimerase [Phycisphaerae bacterium]HSA25247.1 dipeptide epimerase [Phycisphaerae bacterium]
MKLTWHRRSLRLRHPFNIARREREDKVDKEILLIQIEHDGLVGWGESAPTSYYHQSLDSAEAALARIAGMLGQDPLAFDAVLGSLWEQYGNETATIAAIDGAMHDLAGKLLGVPLWRFLGLDRARMPLTSFTIGIDDLEVIRQKTREAAEYPILKVKVGTPQDDAILSVIREEAPNKVVRVDANCGWNSANVLERCRTLSKKYRIEFIEQPTAAGAHDALPEVRAAGLCPIVADESCVGVQGVLACAGVFDGINIKLSKCGGIRRAIQMIHTARSAGLKIMLGCMIESSVGIAAAAHLGPLVDWVDLDGHLLLANDPFEGIGGRGGRLTLNDRPGLGLVER